jgi:polysaccharide export outer membrane protein
MKNGRTYLGVILCALLLSVVAAHAQKPQEGPPATPPAGHDSYVIGESDMLAINVWHEPELTRVIPVRTDGKITLPLIGELQASGQTVEQLRATIASQLKRFLEDPEVTVIVQEPRSQFFTVVGKVQKPGSYPLGQRLTVMDGLALSGGFKDFAKVGKIRVVRTHRDGRVERLPFNYKLAAGGDLNQNFPLEPHDMIIVP